MKTPKLNYPIKAFSTQAKFHAWLDKNHAQAKGLWIRFYKKGSGIKTITYPEALDEALCYGWIDGRVNKYDFESWIHSFTPRRPKSGWSKRNTEHVERLLKEKRVKAQGLKEIEAAKADGRWKRAYSSPKNAKPPEDFLALLSKDEKAKAFFESLNRANVYAIVYRLETAKKPETREKRMKIILTMMKKRKKFHP